VLDGQVGDAFGRIHLVGSRQRSGRASLQAAAAASATVGYRKRQTLHSRNNCLSRRKGTGFRPVHRPRKINVTFSSFAARTSSELKPEKPPEIHTTPAWDESGRYFCPSSPPSRVASPLDTGSGIHKQRASKLPTAHATQLQHFHPLEQHLVISRLAALCRLPPPCPSPCGRPCVARNPHRSLHLPSR